MGTAAAGNVGFGGNGKVAPIGYRGNVKAGKVLLGEVPSSAVKVRVFTGPPGAGVPDGSGLGVGLALGEGDGLPLADGLGLGVAVGTPKVDV